MIRTKEIHAQFHPGQVVHHRRYDYRGVIVDVDPTCQADEAWYRSNQTQPNRNQPWYHVLVDGGDFTTYVAEENLEPDPGGGPISHPLIPHFFREFRDGQYVPKASM